MSVDALLEMSRCCAISRSSYLASRLVPVEYLALQRYWPHHRSQKLSFWSDGLSLSSLKMSLCGCLLHSSLSAVPMHLDYQSYWWLSYKGDDCRGNQRHTLIWATARHTHTLTCARVDSVASVRSTSPPQMTSASNSLACLSSSKNLNYTTWKGRHSSPDSGLQQ